MLPATLLVSATVTFVTDAFRSILVRDSLRPFFLEGNGLHLLDQRALPVEEKWNVLTTIEEIAQAIETLAVRGAPAIGGAAALAMAMYARSGGKDLAGADARLRRTRPTAKNLFFALDAIKAAGSDVNKIVDAAEKVVFDDEAACEAMGKAGAELFADGDVVMTICHTGALATCGQGTALGVIKSARAQGKNISVVALETRPLLQGARLTAWECARENIPCTLITDGMSAFAMKRLKITKAIVGADRITRDGSTANKIGTYTLATVAKAHGIPFYVAAPTSTFDLSLSTGDEIPIEERAPTEVNAHAKKVWNPAFDVTPPELITAFITEKGVTKTPPT
jgi:methylthioribose-1-phosphate isomerase